MRSVKALIVLSQALSSSVFALRLNVNPPAAHATKGSHEWVVHIQGHGANTVKGDRNPISFAQIDMQNVKYSDFPHFLRGPNYAKIAKWEGRGGNNLQQLMHVIAYAESKSIPTVQLPEGGPVRRLFDLPTVLNIKPKPSQADCTFNHELFFYNEQCSLGYSKSDYRQALLTYVKPYLKAEAASVCATKEPNSRELVVHLRGEDLANRRHPESRMAPCSFYRHLVESHNFTSVYIVAQDGKEDKLCRQDIFDFFNGSAVQVRETPELWARSADHRAEKTFFDDVCTVMTSQHVAFGLTTFGESYTLMNENLVKVYVPAIKYNGMNHTHVGKYIDITYGDNDDQSGSLQCNDNVQSCPKGNIEYELHDVPGFKNILTGRQKTEYLHELRGKVVYPPPMKTCRLCKL